LFYNFCHKNLHIFALPSSAVLKPAQAGLVTHKTVLKILNSYFFQSNFIKKRKMGNF
jgi:hypothetical protein